MSSRAQPYDVVILGYSVNHTADVTKVRSGGLLWFVMIPLIKRLPKEDTGNVALLRLSRLF
jgi:hypothetical protein